MWHMHEGHWWGMHWIWWILWGIIIFGLFVSPKSILGLYKKKDTPLDILKKRYAAGEISTEEYEERKKVLEKD